MILRSETWVSLDNKTIGHRFPSSFIFSVPSRFSTKIIYHFENKTKIKETLWQNKTWEHKIWSPTGTCHLPEPGSRRQAGHNGVQHTPVGAELWQRQHLRPVAKAKGPGVGRAEPLGHWGEEGKEVLGSPLASEASQLLRGSERIQQRDHGDISSGTPCPAISHPLGDTRSLR